MRSSEQKSIPQNPASGTHQNDTPTVQGIATLPGRDRRQDWDQEGG
jgi:hypothetical protein